MPRAGWGEVDGGATEVGGWQGESASSVALQSLPLLFPMRRSFSLVAAAAAACVLTRFSLSPIDADLTPLSLLPESSVFPVEFVVFTGDICELCRPAFTVASLLLVSLRLFTMRLDSATQ